MKKIALIIMFLATLSTIAQTTQRVKIKGTVLVPENDDKEGITVYNSSSNQGTITDVSGAFTLAVQVNDRVVFSAIQYNNVIVIIDEGIVENQQLRLELTEDIQQLNDVVVRPYDLSGNIRVDANSVETYSGVTFTDQTIAELERENEIKPDELTSANNVALRGFNFQNGINFVNIFKLAFQKRDQYKVNKNAIAPDVDSEIRSMYNDNFFKKNLNISMDNISAFIFYAEQNGLDKELLKKGNELDLIEFLLVQSKSFKNTVKNN